MQLVQKICACGCGRKFKALATSLQVYYSYYECDPKGLKPQLHKLEFAARGFNLLFKPSTSPKLRKV